VDESGTGFDDEANIKTLADEWQTQQQAMYQVRFARQRRVGLIATVVGGATQAVRISLTWACDGVAVAGAGGVYRRGERGPRRTACGNSPHGKHRVYLHRRR
jgi:hypothetical protein